MPGGNKKLYMWLSVAGVLFVIFLVWLALLKYSIKSSIIEFGEQQRGAGEQLQNQLEELKNIFQDFNATSTPASATSTNAAATSTNGLGK